MAGNQLQDPGKTAVKVARTTFNTLCHKG